MDRSVRLHPLGYLWLDRRHLRRNFGALAVTLPCALAISLGLAKADPRHGGRIRAAQIAAIVRLTPVAMLASCLNTIILIAVLWHLGSLTWPVSVWAAVQVAVASNFVGGWLRVRSREPAFEASERAIRRTAVNGFVVGVVWGVLPIIALPGASGPVQLMVGCLCAGMMCAGGFVLCAVPLAGIAYVGAVLFGSYLALALAGVSATHLGLAGFLTSCAVVVGINLSWNAKLFVDHFLAEARLEDEVAAREQAQVEMAQAQRMAALGQIAGGIAHDFNNILQSITGNANLIAGRADDPAQSRRLSACIVVAAERGGAIGRRLLAFARQDVLAAEPIVVQDLLGDAHELLRHVLQNSIDLCVQVPASLPHVLADRAQLETVLVNLATNARDAMGECGTLTLRAEAECIAETRRNPQLRDGDYIRLTVADTGVGMTPATLARAIEPFFTTKPQGKGTGLGLSMAKGFAEQSGGAFALTSAPGQGTTVTLWLPKAEEAAADAAWPRRLAPTRAATAAACHLVIVDDDRDVRDSLALSLTDAGYTVTSVRDAAAALAILGEARRVDVLISDLLMPGMNGTELICAARLRRPGLSAILLTGHVGEFAAPEFGRIQSESVAILRKPIRLMELVACLSTLHAPPRVEAFNTEQDGYACMHYLENSPDMTLLTQSGEQAR